MLVEDIFEKNGQKVTVSDVYSPKDSQLGNIYLVIRENDSFIGVAVKGKDYGNTLKIISIEGSTTDNVGEHITPFGHREIIELSKDDETESK